MKSSSHGYEMCFCKQFQPNDSLDGKCGSYIVEKEICTNGLQTEEEKQRWEQM